MFISSYPVLLFYISSVCVYVSITLFPPFSQRRFPSSGDISPHFRDISVSTSFPSAFTSFLQSIVFALSYGAAYLLFLPVIRVACLFLHVVYALVFVLLSYVLHLILLLRLCFFRCGLRHCFIAFVIFLLLFFYLCYLCSSRSLFVFVLLLYHLPAFFMFS